VTFRAATAADADRLAAGVADGMEIYLTFAPAGWSPSTPAGDAERLRSLLADARVWCRLAEDERGLAGQVMVLPATIAARPVDDPALAHLRNLFVRRDHWGSGLARSLHDAALEAARERDYGAVRLFVAVGQTRARRFYEREGWAPAAAPYHDTDVGLEMVEYRRAL
jgi:GNAT superfamily N-acetyltransferase